jgi:predicted deacylase
MNHDQFDIAGVTIRPGETRDVEVAVSESYSGDRVSIPVRVIRATEVGPTVVVTAAVHGDEVNGTGIVRRLIMDTPLVLNRGTLILVPVVNILGFENLSRYLPDRRDLNRCFPGRPDGSLASRFANSVFRQLIQPCDYCIDLHTASVRRTNYPNVRGNLAEPRIKRIAKAFGCALVINSAGSKGTLRRSATEAGCSTIILEAGEVWKIEPAIVELGASGVQNVLIELEMIEGERFEPAFQTTIQKTKWTRADSGGLLQFHVAPGEFVEGGQPLATISNLLGRENSILLASRTGIVLGMTTIPSVKPGDPVCHLAMPPAAKLQQLRTKIQELSKHTLHGRVRDDLATSLTISEVGDGAPPPTETQR